MALENIPRVKPESSNEDLDQPFYILLICSQQLEVCAIPTAAYEVTLHFVCQRKMYLTQSIKEHWVSRSDVAHASNEHQNIKKKRKNAMCV